jgi:hypothetical protein
MGHAWDHNSRYVLTGRETRYNVSHGSSYIAYRELDGSEEDTMTYQMELMIEQRLADLRRAGEASQSLPANPHTWRRAARARLGGRLVRLGDRLAQPAGVPAIR